MVHQFTESKRTTIINQLKKLGCSCDWEREQFTMSPEFSKEVDMAFQKLHKKGLIYKANYIVNWCSRCQTAISDDEVEHKEQTGKMYYLKYKLNRDGR